MSDSEAPFEKYIELVDAVNNSKTRDEYHQKRERLSGFLEGIEACGRHSGFLLMYGDEVQEGRGVDRDMCGGMWLDWEPQADADNPTEDGA